MKYTAIAACLILGGSSLILVAAIQASPDSLCVAHLEVPEYPKIARLAQLQEIVDVMIDINESGEVISARASKDSLFRSEVENNVRTWTFKHLPAHAKFPITHAIRFEFKLDGKRSDSPPKVTFDLPERVRIVGHAPVPRT